MKAKKMHTIHFIDGHSWLATQPTSTGCLAISLCHQRQVRHVVLPVSEPEDILPWLNQRDDSRALSAATRAGSLHLGDGEESSATPFAALLMRLIGSCIASELTVDEAAIQTPTRIEILIALVDCLKRNSTEQNSSTDDIFYAEVLPLLNVWRTLDAEHSVFHSKSVDGSWWSDAQEWITDRMASGPKGRGNTHDETADQNGVHSSPGTAPK